MLCFLGSRGVTDSCAGDDRKEDGGGRVLEDDVGEGKGGDIGRHDGRYLLVDVQGIKWVGTVR